MCERERKSEKKERERESGRARGRATEQATTVVVKRLPLSLSLSLCGTISGSRDGHARAANARYSFVISRRQRQPVALSRSCTHARASLLEKVSVCRHLASIVPSR